MCGYNDAFARLPRSRSHLGGEVRWVSTGTPAFNRVYDARFREQDVEQRVADVMARFASWGAPFTWQVNPSSSPARLGDVLERRGVRLGERWLGMTLDLDELLVSPERPEGMTVHEVASAEALSSWVDVLARANLATGEMGAATCDLFMRLKSGFDVPWHLYLACLDGVPVATSGRIRDHDVAGIYWVATLPEARGRGVASALVTSTLERARAAGERIAVLQSTPEVKQIYQRLGFTERCTIGVHSWNP